MPDPGSILARHREAAGLSQEALARRAGVSRSSLAKVEAGLAPLGLHLAMRVGRALGLSAGWLDDIPPTPVRKRAPRR